ncbi:MAG: FMN-binding protein [Spirochaetaceae bacterium]|jgi:hypothetical protein|nr:FMN-binding protein [Spirochaetaceae bacterium]
MKKTEIVLLLVLAIILFGCAQNPPSAAWVEIPFTPSTPAPPPEVIHIDPTVIIEPNPGPGPYTGIAMGFGGVVEVTLEIRERVIISAVVTGNAETVGIGTRALDNLPGAIVTANSIVVDTITGATSTSRAVLEAAAKALGKAGLTDGDLAR